MNTQNLGNTIRFRNWFLLCHLLFCTLTLCAQSGQCGKGLQWNLADSTLTVSGHGAMDNMDPIGEVFTPWYNERMGIKRIVISEGVTRIGNFAFLGCASLESVSFPASLSSIGSDAFSGCAMLQELNCGGRIDNIGDYAFNACHALKRVCLQQTSLREIQTGVFSGCSALTTVRLPETLSFISKNAFNNCTSLTDITLPK
ncbi:MAG: leucine-rich repeat domain-containing protein, partial [Bacteroidaceae bacterium]|nr:leucine-rich repeat domain-containing protein [Bacteroidaceae bacterium]